MEPKFTQFETAKTTGPLPVNDVETSVDKTGEPVASYFVSLVRRRGLIIKVKVPGPPVITKDEIDTLLDADETPRIQFSDDFEATIYAYVSKSTGAVVSGLSARASSATLVTGKGGGTR